MNPSKIRILFKSTLALTLAAALCPLMPASRAQTTTGEEVEKRALKVSGEIGEYLRKTGSTRVTVIIQINGPVSQSLVSYLTRVGVRLKGQYTLLGSYAVEVPATLVPGLANFPEIRSVSRDRETISTGHVTATTGADAVRAQKPGRGRAAQKLDGAGVGIAVLDSGIYSEHVSLRESKAAGRRVVALDFTGEGTTGDPYGHGSHVAAAAAG